MYTFKAREIEHYILQIKKNNNNTTILISRWLQNNNLWLQITLHMDADTVKHKPP